ncbi:MAG: TIGR03757 family integrating conjugative element protein [Halioglobus sp.]
MKCLPILGFVSSAVVKKRQSIRSTASTSCSKTFPEIYPSMTVIAKQLVMERVQRVDAQLSSELENAARGLVQAMQYGIDRYPAIVFDGEVVVYGVTDVTVATQLYQRWQTGTRGSEESLVLLRIDPIAVDAVDWQHRHDYHPGNCRADKQCGTELHALDAGGYLLLAALLSVRLQCAHLTQSRALPTRCRGEQL